MMKVLSTIFYTIFVTAIVGIAGLVLGTMLPIPGNIEMKIVKSGSMEPAITTGSIVIVKPSASYAVGDVITFGKDTKTDIPTTHRVMEIKTDGTFVTKGDANEEVDQNPVARRDVIGKVIVAVPYAGFVLDFARTKLGFTLLIGIPAALVILEEVLTITNETRKWWRRRRDGDRGGSAGGGETLSTHLKLVYGKRHKMDEIFVPMVIQRSFFDRALRGDAYGTATVTVLCLIFTSTVFSGASGGTLSYFSDIERSVGNSFTAWEEIIEEVAPFAARMMAEEEPEGDVLGTTDEEALADVPVVEIVEEEPVPVVEEETPSEEEAAPEPEETIPTEPTPEPTPEPATVEPVPEPTPIEPTPEPPPIVE